VTSAAKERRGVAADRGELAIVLHSHMPYVEGFGTWPFGEEWLFEAMATSYLPLVELCERWAADGEQSLLTVGVTPVLGDQLVLPDVGERFLRFLRETREQTHELDIDGLERAGQSHAAQALRRSLEQYRSAADSFDRLAGDLVGALARLERTGVIELWASTATHAILPLLATELGVRLQVATGIESHQHRFGGWSGGFWLPECAFRDGLDEQLALAGARAFCVYRTDGGRDGSLQPLAAAGDAVAIPIDWETIALVWDDDGYPSDPLYRDYHAHTTNGLRPYANGGGPYAAEAALARAREHAHQFVAAVMDRLDRHRAATGRPGLAVCALDTELLGHWWHEGPAWLEAVVERALEVGLALSSLPAALGRHEPAKGLLAEASWGDGKDLKTWDSPRVADLVWPVRRAELELAAAVSERNGPATQAALERSARELLALQSSDWAFMETRSLAADYPRSRIRNHAVAFERALAAARPHMEDSGEVIAAASQIEPRLRGLAPRLRLSTLLEPPSPWGRPAREGGEDDRCES
jgi:1,4-alpha-glucan branching enzyme